MTKELKQQFTLRITQANKTQLITILYEMTLLYVEEAKEALVHDCKADFKHAVQKTRGCINELISSLNPEYELAQNLMQLYLYINRELNMASGHYAKENLDNISRIVVKLKEAYRELEKHDMSEPVMGNAQTVYAGLTYGKNTLTESITDSSLNRGFRA